MDALLGNLFGQCCDETFCHLDRCYSGAGGRPEGAGIFMMLKQSRNEFLHALSGCIEHAPAEQQRELFESFRRYRKDRGERQWRTMMRMQMLAHLLATIEDALLLVAVQRDQNGLLLR
jgi:hypothetical protein